MTNIPHGGIFAAMKKPAKSTTPSCCTKEHPSHQSELGRLNRITGQLDGVKKMIDERRYCPEIITLLRGARAAIKAVEANMLERHLASCVVDAFNSDDEPSKAKKMNELKDLFKRFD